MVRMHRQTPMMCPQEPSSPRTVLQYCFTALYHLVSLTATPAVAPVDNSSLGTT